MYRSQALAGELVVVVSDKYAFAIDASSGMTRWAYALRTRPCRAVVANDRVYIAGDAELASVDYQTGKQIFHIHTNLAPDVTLVVDGDRIYVGARGMVGCFDQFGQKLWGNDLGTASGIGFALPGITQQIDLTG